MISSDSVSEDSPAPLDALVENHRAFLRYLERRVGDRELAEDILQDAFNQGDGSAGSSAGR